jgi:hypothetical protein
MIQVFINLETKEIIDRHSELIKTDKYKKEIY